MALNKLNAGEITKWIAAKNRELGNQVDKPEPNSKSDGGGLTLFYLKGEKTEWRFRYEIKGKGNSVTLGTYPDLSLSGARELHKPMYALWKQGKDPAQVRRDERLSNIEALDSRFEMVARNWFDKWKDSVAPDTAKMRWWHLEKHVLPRLGRKPVSEISTSELIQVHKAIESKGKTSPVHKTWTTCNLVFMNAVSNGLCQRNPCADVRFSIVFKTKKVEHHSRLGIKEVPEFLRAIDQYSGTDWTILGLRLMAYVFVRTKEMVGATWDEVDLENARWTIPVSRMKRRTIEHVIDLPTQAVEIINRLKELSGGSKYLFPSVRGIDRHMSDKTMWEAIAVMGYKGRMTVHGFRGVARTALGEMGYQRDFIKAQLSHTVSDKTDAAYNDAQYRDQRKAMLQDWANHLDAIKAGGNITALRAKVRA